VGDLAQFSIQELRESTARVLLEQQPAPQAAMVAIDNPTGEIKALVGGYSFEDSKFNRATQSVRQVGSSFKIYVYADAIAKGFTPFDTILDAPFTTISGGQAQLRRKIRREHHPAPRAGWFAQRARRKVGGKSWHQQRCRDYAKVWDYHAAAAIPATGAGFGGHEADRTRFRVHGISG
jgi:hypothetical protein